MSRTAFKNWWRGDDANAMAEAGDQKELAWTAWKAAADYATRNTRPRLERIGVALSLAARFGGIDGDHHKAWVIDQMVRALIGGDADYAEFVAECCSGADGPDTYTWETGIPP